MPEKTRSLPLTAASSPADGFLSGSTSARHISQSSVFVSAQDIHKASIGKTANISNRGHLKTDTRKPGFYRNVAKRGLDTLLVLLSLPGVLPLIFVLAVLVAREGGKPFYKQKRIGMNGRVFYMWKLRSMVHDADKVLETYLQDDPKMRAEWKTKQKLINDPRVTSLGRFLRKSSIDELPQLFNVLKGEMSLVGPRPMMEDQKSLYPGNDYYEVRPGITGFWQISDRNATSFADRAFYDARYNRELSFKTDFMILLATVRVVLRGTGH